MLNVDFKTIFKEYYIKRKSEPQLIIESKIIDWVMMYQFMNPPAVKYSLAKMQGPSWNWVL